MLRPEAYTTKQVQENYNIKQIWRIKNIYNAANGNKESRQKNADRVNAWLNRLINIIVPNIKAHASRSDNTYN